MQLNIMYDLPVYSFDIIMKYICCIYIVYYAICIHVCTNTEKYNWIKYNVPFDLPFLSCL